MSYHKNECEYCGDYSGRYELCRECHDMALDGTIIKNSYGKWIKNVTVGNEYKFYDDSKQYYLKENLMNEWEMRFFDMVRNNIKSKYTIVPQVNMQSLIETDTNKRNDELYRNLDFVLYYDKEFVPFLAIELNGQQHYTNEYWKERDKSVKLILSKVKLPLLTIDIVDIKQMSDAQIWNVVNKVISYINPSMLSKLLKRTGDKMDLSWCDKLIESYSGRKGITTNSNIISKRYVPFQVFDDNL